MPKFDKVTSESTCKNWLDSTAAGLEKEDFLLEVLLDKKILQPEEKKKIRKAKNLLLKTLHNLDTIRGMN